MYNITLIATAHTENGRCNSDALYNILEEVSPQVIFDELPSLASEMFYSDGFDLQLANAVLSNRRFPTIPLEVKAIRKYKQYKDIKIIPVDIDSRQQLQKHKDDVLFMGHTFFKNEHYENLHNEINNSMVQEGFHFLNSNNFLDFMAQKMDLEKSIIESDVDKNRLNNIYTLFREQQYERENEMLQNIYNYSEANQYDQAVFLIGAEHKKSIMLKITEYEKLSEMKLNWTMYGQEADNEFPGAASGNIDRK